MNKHNSEIQDIRILCAISKLCNGGVQTFLLNYAEHLSKFNIHLDFVVQTQEEQSLNEKARSFGSKILFVEPYKKSKIVYILGLANILKKNSEYKIIWLHLNYGNIWPLLAAKIAHIPSIICHSHSNYKASNFIAGYYRKLLHPVFRLLATDLWACSKPSAIWLYGNCKNVTIIHNAVDTEKFSFSTSKRMFIRKTLGIKEEDYLLINVGNLNKAKNHQFLIDVFCKYHKINSRTKLIICGDGELRESIEEQIKKLNLENSINLIGKVQNPEDYMSASDLFIMTSSFEGLPLVAIEAQTSSLPCLFSQAIPKEAIFSHQSMIIKGFDVDIWTKAIEHYSKKNRNREHICINHSGYNVAEEAYKLQRLFKSMIQ